MEKPTCETCPYWQQHPGEFDGDPPSKHGSCIRNSPRPCLVITGVSPTVIWPTTHKTAVCAGHPGYRQIVNAWWEANQPEGEP